MTDYIGPGNGHLVIIGGHFQSEKIYKKIVELAGGEDAPFVIIPTASGEPSYDDDISLADDFKKWFNNVTVLHTYDRATADTEDFVSPLKEAKGVFFGGGRQWRLVDAYAETKTEQAIQAVLDRGGVISGSSAGASIQGSFLARGDTSGNQIMDGDHTKGFGYLKNVAIDQHVISRNRHYDMTQILEAHPELLGIGCDEDTAFVINKNRADVIGASYCLIYDGNFWSEEGHDQKVLPSKTQRFFFLKEGDGYDLKERRVLSDRISSG